MHFDNGPDTVLIDRRASTLIIQVSELLHSVMPLKEMNKFAKTIKLKIRINKSIGNGKKKTLQYIIISLMFYLSSGVHGSSKI